MPFISMPGGCCPTSSTPNSPGRPSPRPFTWKAPSAEWRSARSCSPIPTRIPGKIVYPKLELVRLAIPRRVYTQAHIDYVADVLAELSQRAHELRGYRITYAPPLLRHFTAQFEPLQ